MDKVIKLYGRVFIECEIEAKSGLHIGGAESPLAIGGVDNVVIRDPLTGRPYIPGSSLKGKMRSQMEKFYGLPQNRKIGQVYIHTCDNPTDYAGCIVCHIYGVPGEMDFSTSTRLVVRDVPLTDESAEELMQAKTDLPYTEVKWEAAIDRITSAATPRQMERVPAGAVFGPSEMVYSIYEAKDIDRFKNVVEGMQLLEDDYLGGAGSRGSGKIAFCDIRLYIRTQGNYHQKTYYKDNKKDNEGKESRNAFKFKSLADLNANLGQVVEWLRERITISSDGKS